MQRLQGKRLWAEISVSILVAALGVYGYLQYRDLRDERDALLGKLDMAASENAALEQSVRDQQYAIESFQEDLEELGFSVGTLEKLAETDEELLKKYSKVYFLNENYEPAELSVIDPKYAYEEDKQMLIQSDVWRYLRRLLREAEDDGAGLLVASAFRSFDEQKALKSGYKVLYGSGANQFSADQGYSEHQLGTTVDFTTQATGGVFSSFEADPAYKWLEDHAHEYGFTLSYPKNNTFYKFEPWHWRFVGIDLATHLHEEGKHFYDLDQREIDEYLIKLFD